MKAEERLAQIGLIDAKISQLRKEKRDLRKILAFQVRQKKELLQMLDLECEYCRQMIRQRE